VGNTGTIVILAVHLSYPRNLTTYPIKVPLGLTTSLIMHVRTPMAETFRDFLFMILFYLYLFCTHLSSPHRLARVEHGNWDLGWGFGMGYFGLPVRPHMHR